MTRRILLALLVLFGSVCAALAQDDEDSLDLSGPVKNAVDQYILPAHEKLLREASVMDSEMSRYCRGAARPQYERLVEQFAALNDAWAGVYFFRFGPWSHKHRLERFLFWPDRKGRALRQVRKLLKEKKRKLLSDEAFSKRSVAVQGIPALEFLIFVQGLTDPSDKFACDYGLAITGNLKSIALDVLEDWRGAEGYRTLLLEPSKDNPAYQSDAESARELVKALLLGLQVLRDQMLIPVIGTSVENAKPKKAFLRRSGLSLRFIGAASLALKDYVKALQLIYFVDDGLPWTKAVLTEEFDRAHMLSSKLKHPLTEAVLDESEREDVGHLRFTINKAHQVIAKSIVPSMGIKLGFNALDGD